MRYAESAPSIGFYRNLLARRVHKPGSDGAVLNYDNG
jgi:hypothetical protein